MKKAVFFGVLMMLLSCDVFDVLRDKKSTSITEERLEASSFHGGGAEIDSLDTHSWWEGELMYLMGVEVEEVRLVSYSLRARFEDLARDTSPVEVTLWSDGELFFEGTLTAASLLEGYVEIQELLLANFEENLEEHFRANESPVITARWSIAGGLQETGILQHRMDLSIVSSECLSLPIGSDLPDCE